MVIYNSFVNKLNDWISFLTQQSNNINMKVFDVMLYAIYGVHRICYKSLTASQTYFE